jgi:hypothetical protein
MMPRTAWNNHKQHMNNIGPNAYLLPLRDAVVLHRAVGRHNLLRSSL